MLFRDRPDGTRIRQLHALSAVMPYLMRRRNGSAVYFARDLDVENAMRYIRMKNAAAMQTGESGERYSLFGLLLAAAARTLFAKPKLNRFIRGGTLYQRNQVVLSFIVKRRMTEDAPESYAKVFFDRQDTLDSAMGRINDAIAAARREERVAGEKTAALVHSIPGGKYLFTLLFRLLDRMNLAPASMIKDDPLYASAFFANLGSLGLEAPFHHLYEWGTASLFAVMGKLVQEEPKRRDAHGERRHHVSLTVTVDERIAEGFHFAGAASYFSRLVAEPELMEAPLPPDAPGAMKTV